MKLRWTRRAERDLLEIGRYIARNNPSAARRWVEGLRQRARLATERPMAGRVVPEVERDEIREVLRGKYRIVYRVVVDGVVVLTIFEGHRLLPDEAVSEEQ